MLGAWWLSLWLSVGLRFVSLSQKRTCNTQQTVALFQHDWNIVDWNVKRQRKQMYDAL